MFKYNEIKLDSTGTWYPGDRDKQDTSGDAGETSKG